MYYVVLWKNHGKKMCVLALITFILAWLQENVLLLQLWASFISSSLQSQSWEKRQKKNLLGTPDYGNHIDCFFGILSGCN